MLIGRAAVLTEHGGAFQIQEFPRPHAEPGGLVVRIDTATVCGSDVHAWRGELALPVELPLILGHEMAGEIIEIGAGADVDSVGQSLRVGDRVVWAHTPCGHCHECTVVRRPELCAFRHVAYLTSCAAPPHFTGTFAELAVVGPGAGRVRVPGGVESTWAAAGSCALRTVVQALRLGGPVDSLDSVVVQGAGPLGLFATALVSLHRPRRLVVVGGPVDRLALAREWGATHTVSVDQFTTAEERIAEVRRITGRGASLALELAGAPGAMGEGVQVVARGGRYVVMGTLGGPPQPVDAARLVTHGITMVGSMSGSVGDYAVALDLLDRHRDRFAWDRLFGSTYGLGDVAGALQAMIDQREIKPVVRP